jgi:hypothetical protein
MFRCGVQPVKEDVLPPAKGSRPPVKPRDVVWNSALRSSVRALAAQTAWSWDTSSVISLSV